MNTQTAHVLKWLVYPRVCNIPERTHQFQQQWPIQWCDATCTSPGGQGFSHWHGIMCLPFGVFFTNFGIATGGFQHRWRHPISKNLVYYPIYINWVYFKQIIVKKYPIWAKLMFFWYKLVYWWVVKGTKIGTAKVKRPPPHTSQLIYIFETDGFQLFWYSWYWNNDNLPPPIHHKILFLQTHRQ